MSDRIAIMPDGRAVRQQAGTRPQASRKKALRAKDPAPAEERPVDGPRPDKGPARGQGYKGRGDENVAQAAVGGFMQGFVGGLQANAASGMRNKPSASVETKDPELVRAAKETEQYDKGPIRSKDPDLLRNLAEEGRGDPDLEADSGMSR